MLGKDWKTIWEHLRKGWYRPALNAFYVRSFQIWNRVTGKEGIEVVDEDWDYLIVLDACRYDIFEEENWIDGKLSKVTSQGSTSVEWLNENFTDYYEDLVYISANGFVSPVESDAAYQLEYFDSSEHFHDTEMVFMKDEASPVSPPGLVSETALELEEKYPEKRKVIHFMQPHTPYIASDKIENELGNVIQVRRAGYSKEEIVEAYRENLRLVLEEVEDLIEDLDGKIVVTADHGEMLGKYGIWNHPHSVRTKELVEVPWLEVEK